NLSFYAFDLFNICTDEFYNDIGLFYGKGIHNKYGSILFFAGSGITFGNERDKLMYKVSSTRMFQCSEHYSKRFFISPSINLELELILKPLKQLGIGIRGYANANLKHPFTGVSVFISIGNLRE